MGRLKSVSYFSQAKSCCDTEQQMPCCEDVEELLKIDDLSQSIFDFTIDPSLFELYEIRFSEGLPDQSEQQHFCLSNYPNPPPKDRVVFFQIFRI